MLPSRGHPWRMWGSGEKGTVDESSWRSYEQLVCLLFLYNEWCWKFGMWSRE